MIAGCAVAVSVGYWWTDHPHFAALWAMFALGATLMIASEWLNP
jgi:hypothetical protein